MKQTRISILSKTEEQFLMTQMAVLRKRQIQSLSDNKILHDFLTCVSSEKKLVAYEDSNTGNQISWDVSKGFILDLEEAFFDSPENLQAAYEAVRSCFFENFLDEEDHAQLGSESSRLGYTEDLEDLESSSESSSEIGALDTDTDDDELDLLNKVNDLDASTLSADEEEIQADEFSNLSDQQDLETVTDITGNENTDEHTDETSTEDLVAEETAVATEEQEAEHQKSDEQTEVQTHAQDSDVSSEEEQPTSLSENEDVEAPHTDKEITNEESEVVDAENSTETNATAGSTDASSQEQQNPESTDSDSNSTQEASEAVSPDFDNLAKQLADVGMEADKIDSLLTAVRSGKAPLETVQATIEKLKSSD